MCSDCWDFSIAKVPVRQIRKVSRFIRDLRFRKRVSRLWFRGCAVRTCDEALSLKLLCQPSGIANSEGNVQDSWAERQY